MRAALDWRGIKLEHFCVKIKISDTRIKVSGQLVLVARMARHRHSASVAGHFQCRCRLLCELSNLNEWTDA